MNLKNINDILPLVEQPSRYLGSEINAVKKDYAGIKLSVALAFPDLYEVGSSHFGLQILYHILNKQSDIVAERVFTPAVDFEAYLRSSDTPLCSLETRRPLNKFDIIGFSLLYELNFTNILTMLDLVKIPFFAEQRDNSHPFIIAGGPCTCNPEPVADFFDAIVIGDGEEVIVEISKAWIQWKEDSGKERDILLKRWSQIEGVYIPSFFEAKYDENGFQTVVQGASGYKRVIRSIIRDLDNAPFPNEPVVPYGRPVHDRLRLEISRGCSRGCRFCQAGMIYRPVRERSLKNIIDISDKSIASTGYEDVSLLSLSTGDYCSLTPLLERLMGNYEPKHIAVSFPSLRAGALTPELVNLVKKVRKTGFTIAPEAGSQRLRDVINKNITEEQIIHSVNTALSMGWQVIKLYFMAGLPTETDDDIKEMIELVYKLRKSRIRKNSSINISVTTFIPKAHTPFQWSSQISLAESEKKIGLIRRNLNISGINFKWQNPKTSMLEGLWARGDRRFADLLVTAYQKGCRFDGWSDKFDFKLWEEAIAEAGIDPDFYLLRKRSVTEPLPWDHIDTRISKEFLKGELDKAMNTAVTADCREYGCSHCGVCDFDIIEPKFCRDIRKHEEIKPTDVGTAKTNFKKMKISFKKMDQSRFFGHLELVNIFLRAIRRAGIEVAYSEGFHPMPKISFEDTLPIGMESRCETLYLTVSENTEPGSITEKLNRQLPEGLSVYNCTEAVKDAGSKPGNCCYEASLSTGGFDNTKLELYEMSSGVIIERTNKKGITKKIDLKEAIKTLDLISQNRLKMALSSEPGKMVRPVEALKKIFDLSEERLKTARIVKTSIVL
ncbi:MAG: TIGR03960 family B12-binding radical SAM protein [Desulfobacteraceae bacterium]|nr:MAG: TIGR03960 family B12-binding radical SAM protein [Desulfobacteraceae bacterium]